MCTFDPILLILGLKLRLKQVEYRKYPDVYLKKSEKVSAHFALARGLIFQFCYRYPVYTVPSKFGTTIKLLCGTENVFTSTVEPRGFFSAIQHSFDPAMKVNEFCTVEIFGSPDLISRGSLNLK